MKLHVKLVGYNLDGLWHKVARLAALQRKRERRFDLHLTLGGRVGSEVNSTNPEIVVVCIFAGNNNFVCPCEPNWWVGCLCGFV